MPNILIVDDSALDRQLIKGILEKVPGYFALQAADGSDALNKLSEWDVDLVLTDMQMPEMDGLELVRAIRRRFPDTPTILATAFGSEQIAAEALAAGAAGYVPKTRVAELLVPTVRDVLNILYADRSYTRLLDRATETVFAFQLDNDPSYISSVVDLCEKMLGRMSTLDQNERLRTVVAIEQALSNALFRGNLEIGPSYIVPHGSGDAKGDAAEIIAQRLEDPNYQHRQVAVRFSIDGGRLHVTIKDQGPGFQSAEAPDLAKDSGRGLVLMNAFMDSVEFDASGNQVTLVKCWEKESPLKSQKNPAEGDSEPGGSRGEKEIGRLITSSGGKIELRQRSLVIGRRDSCHIVLPYKEVSSHHCQLQFKNGQWFVRDLKSQNGTHVNGQRISQMNLSPGDILGVANYEYEIQF